MKVYVVIDDRFFDSDAVFSKKKKARKDLNKYDRDSFENELEVRRAAADLRAHADYLDRVADSMRHTGI